MQIPNHRNKSADEIIAIEKQLNLCFASIFFEKNKKYVKNL